MALPTPVLQQAARMGTVFCLCFFFCKSFQELRVHPPTHGEETSFSVSTFDED